MPEPAAAAQSRNGKGAPGRASTASRWARLLASLFGVFLAVVAIELGLRVYFRFGEPDRQFDTAGPRESRRWIPHPFLPYAGRPNATFDLHDDDGSSELIVTNSYGFRAHEFPTEKRPEDFFILCFGGSTTYGFKTPTNALTWPERLEHRLQERYPERRVRVFNLGMDMASSAFSIVNLALVGVHLQPDLVISYHGYNDLSVLNASNYRWDHSHSYNDLTTRAGYQSRLPGWLRWSNAAYVATGILDEFFQTNDLYAAARHDEPLHGDPWQHLDALLVNYATLHSLATGAGSAILFSTFQFRDANDSEVRFNDALRTFFAARGWPFVDQDALLPDHDPTINVDPCHFTQKGNELMAQNYFEHIVAHHLIERESQP